LQYAGITAHLICMKRVLIISAIIGLTACVGVAVSQSDSHQTAAAVDRGDLSRAVFAGGCFWCVEADFDKLDGVKETISGYTGGTLDNPTYKQVSKGGTGHYEAVEILYDPDIVSYETLVEYFLRHVDPTDPGGQFCDRGDSYRTAIFATDEEQARIAKDEIETVDNLRVLAYPIVTPVLKFDVFWPAETYHQDYYEKNPLRYRYYRASCGRDNRVEEVWSKVGDTLSH